MPNPAAPAREGFRVVYWGPSEAAKRISLAGLTQSARDGENARLMRIPTSLDPASLYDELSLTRAAGDTSSASEFTVVSAPGAKELAPVGKQLLDGVHGVVLVLDLRRGQTESNLTSLKQLRADLADYGRDLDDLPLVVQHPPLDDAQATELDVLLARLDIRPIALHGAGDEIPGSFRPPLDSMVRALLRLPASGKPPRASGGEALATAEPGLGDRGEPLPGRARSEVAALLEASMLAEEAEGPSDTEIFEEFLEMNWPEAASPAEAPAEVAPDPKLEILSVGWPESVGQGGVRIPLSLRGPGGDPVPLTLRIELEDASGERKP